MRRSVGGSYYTSVCLGANVFLLQPLEPQLHVAAVPWFTVEAQEGSWASYPVRNIDFMHIIVA